MTSLHGAVDRHQGVMLDHDQPPDGHCQRQPDRYVVDHKGEVGVKQVEGSPGNRRITFETMISRPENRNFSSQKM